MNSRGVVSDVASVQYGSISLNNATSGTATITSVDTTKSCVVWLGDSMLYPGSVQAKYWPILTLTNATTVTATAPNASTCTTKFMVVTWNNVKSLQTGQISMGGYSATATITSVNTAKALLIYQGSNSNDTGNADSGLIEITLTNSTTITADRDNNTGSGFGTGLVNYAVVEFN